MTAAKQPGHFSTKNASSQSWSSRSSPSVVIPQATASVAVSTAWVGPTGGVLATLKTPSGRWANDGTCSNCSAPTLYRMCGPLGSNPGSILLACPPCLSRLRPIGPGVVQQRPPSDITPRWQPGQAWIAAEGGAGRRSAERRGRADGAIARSAPPGVAASLPEGTRSLAPSDPQAADYRRSGRLQTAQPRDQESGAQTISVRARWAQPP